MSRSLITLLISIIPLFSIRYDIGITGSTGYGISRWNVDVYDSSGTYITDHLQSSEPVFSAGIMNNVLLTPTVGIRAGLHYAWYAYRYTYHVQGDPYDMELTWQYRNMLIPVGLVFGVPAGPNRFIAGYGLVICKQLQGKAVFYEGNDVLYVEDIPPDDLETSVAPQFLIGMELAKGHLTVSPAIGYVYNLNGIDEDFAFNTTTHYILLTVSVFYRIL